MMRTAAAAVALIVATTLSLDCLAWTTVSTTTTAVRRRTRLCLNTALSIKSSPQDDSNDDDGKSILEDDQGHINALLASSIYEWDKAHHEQQANYKFPYSTRAALRLVNQLAKQVWNNNNNDQAAGSSTTTTPTAKQHHHLRMTYSDLVQEGVVALLQAMQKFDHAAANNPTKESFEAFISNYVLQQLSKCLDQNRHESVSDNALSVESTVEIYSPILEATAQFTDEHVHPELMDNADIYIRDENAEEGDDEQYVHQEQLAGPLRDMIPDTNVNANQPFDLVVNKMLQDDLHNLLQQALNEQERLVISMRFGLTTDSKQHSWHEIANMLGLSQPQANKVGHAAMNKLRASLTVHHFDDFLGDEEGFEDEMVEDSI